MVPRLYFFLSRPLWNCLHKKSVIDCGQSSEKSGKERKVLLFGRSSLVSLDEWEMCQT